ncbi:MAG: L,D-transpeptidase family protein [Sphingomonadales bacterium]|nr:L,D-transpeptidase family protein [Sphingomonadales bacterium]MDE2570642.1 L,D-transpeptidase family protein [Sphingomonadales bacterium]
MSAPLPDPAPPGIAQALESGVLIVISKASQRMHVFKDGEPWLTTRVSTGRRGHSTPSGIFPILQKQEFHRSNIYSNAPMPYMQRLTWSGIAIHAGHVPNYPASHGCIRVPYAAARSLYGLTRASDTTVVIMNEAMKSDEQARRLALSLQRPTRPDADVPAAPPETRLADAGAPPQPQEAPAATAVQPRFQPGEGQTIQLAAALSPQDAEAHWQWLLSKSPGIGRFGKAVVPATVGSRRYFRLRASGPGAFAYCSQLKSTGIDCFKVL